MSTPERLVARSAPRDLANCDPEISAAIEAELRRQREEIELIASENFVSRAVLEAQGSVLTNKYAEGYPGRRYYAGCEWADQVEVLAIERAKRLFGSAFANVQPHSGTQANSAVLFALLKPGDTILGMSLAAGGHLTHGAPANISGKWFKAVGYGVQQESGLIDYNETARLAEIHRPKLIIGGGSAYARIVDFARLKSIAKSVGAYLMVDMAHFAGLVAGGVHPNPLLHADVVTATTHKTLRGPRGGLILTNDAEIARLINSAVFPGMQGGPLVHIIAAKAVALGEALRPEFRQYAERIVQNAQMLARVLAARGYGIVSEGTDTHLLLVDLRPKHLTGNVAETALGHSNITCNKNSIPFDLEKPTVTSGIRLGSPAGTTRGFGPEEFSWIAERIADVLDGLAESPENNASVELFVKNQVINLCRKFPLYPEFG